MGLEIGTIETSIINRLEPLKIDLENIYPSTLPDDALVYSEANNADITVIIPTSDSDRPDAIGGIQLATLDITVAIALSHRYKQINAIEPVLDKIIDLLKGYAPCRCSYPMWFIGHRLFPPSNGLWGVEVYFRLEKMI